MNSSLNLTLDTFHPQVQEQANYYYPNYSLQWRQGQLWVKADQGLQSAALSSPDRQAWLVECLRRSSVRLVRLDPALGEPTLKFWADACEQAGKAAYLLIPSTQELPNKQRPSLWYLKRSLDWLLAAWLTLVLSPLLLVLAILVRSSSPGPVLFQQWRVGRRGRLFRILKFRTMAQDAEQNHHRVMLNQRGLHKLVQDPRVTPVGRWMRKYSLDELPQLFNVLQGDMSLVGPRPWALYDAVRISPEGQHRLNATPGITGFWQVQSRSQLLDLDQVTEFDLQYLRQWSLWKDFKILLLTLPKVISGFGAY